MKNYFLSREAMSRAFDSAALGRLRTAADTKIALMRHVQNDRRLDAASTNRAEWDDVIRVSLRIRELARKRTGLALACLLGYIQGSTGVEPDGWLESDPALLLPLPGAGPARACQMRDGQGWLINAGRHQVEIHRDAASYVLLAQTDTGEMGVFLLASGSPGVVQASFDDEFPGQGSVSLNAVLALRGSMLRTRFHSESDTIMIAMWMASLLCGLSDRLFSMAKLLHTTIDPRQAKAQLKGSALHHRLARIDALLLTQELSMRTMLTVNVNGSLDLASARSNSHRVIESAFQASTMVLRTLGDTQEVVLLDAIRLQVQAVAAIHGLSSKLVAEATASDVESSKDKVGTYG